MLHFRWVSVSLPTRLWARGQPIAACEAVGLTSIGAERYVDYYDLSLKAIPALAKLQVDIDQGELPFASDFYKSNSPTSCRIRFE